MVAYDEGGGGGLYSPVPAPAYNPVLNTTNVYQSPSVLQQLYGISKANYNTGLAFNKVSGALNDAQYDLETGNANKDYDLALRQLGIQDDRIARQKSALSRQGPLLSSLADHQNLEYSTRESALQRQMQGLSDQRSLEEQLWG